MNLYEYQNKEKYNESFKGLEGFLDEIWSKREKSGFYPAEQNEKKVESQRFIQFLHNTKEIKSNKYVGVINYNGKQINLLPKIFHQKNKETSDTKIHHTQLHLLWWLSYCRKIKFPNYQTNLGNTKSNFFEILIYLFSKYTKNLLHNSIYQQYEEINRELSFVKGRINTQRYINQNLSTGRWHKINCTFDAFEFDNEFNRIVKYVAKLLFTNTQNQENKKNLREILFILDEVTDIQATAQQCQKIKFNQVFSEFETVRDYCQLFLSNSVSFNYKNELKLFAFLLPMEYVFEDFIFGFIAKELPEITAKAQKSNTFLDTKNTFKLKPDLWLQTPSRNLIADTKYKIVYLDESDAKKGIAQTDLYQMLAYAVRFKIQEIILFYPNTILQNTENSSEFIIEDELANSQQISIKAFQIPIINFELLENKLSEDKPINQLFESTKKRLKAALENIILQNRL